MKDTFGPGGHNLRHGIELQSGRSCASCMVTGALLRKVVDTPFIFIMGFQRYFAQHVNLMGTQYPEIDGFSINFDRNLMKKMIMIKIDEKYINFGGAHQIYVLSKIVMEPHR